ncbi:ATP-binding protein [Sphaerisporangium siamense]|uniref:Anti-sigma regulatory factor (Ser/Thr protein kinase) n=1 Tax=Sphaerisporangium siamense TaxID=795645 RepID=A0A7W7G5S6_9ACTN|nr:ATP-binding protein [Sphaerisporangium siamense]MBB4698813.1 anti-sigma regulatory factor (Ser/Thr protein kinase) [Sphaerisporangium siamense]GII89150.1 ATP-binding protein [Sphaerisporangium siamense]
METDHWEPRGAEISGLGRTGTTIKTARDFTVTTLRAWGLGELSYDARLVISELVTNAVRHAGEPTRVRLLHRATHLVCAVADPTDRPPVVTDADQYAETGRGLRLVESLSCSWGWRVFEGRGKLVWAAFTAPAVIQQRRATA